MGVTVIAVVVGASCAELTVNVTLPWTSLPVLSHALIVNVCEPAAEDEEPVRVFVVLDATCAPSMYAFTAVTLRPAVAAVAAAEICTGEVTEAPDAGAQMFTPAEAGVAHVVGAPLMVSLNVPELPL